MRGGEKLNTVYVAAGTRKRIDRIIARNRLSNVACAKTITAVVQAALGRYIEEQEEQAEMAQTKESAT